MKHFAWGVALALAALAFWAAPVPGAEPASPTATSGQDNPTAATVPAAPVGPAHGADWPQWRGPSRNNVSAEAIAWPAAGPKPLWKAAVGEGFSCVAISEGRAYTTGSPEDQYTVWCLDARTGAVLWKYTQPNAASGTEHLPAAWRKDYPGPRATPTVDGRLVYTVSRTGELLALEAATGTVVWSADYVKDFGAKMPRWGFAGSPLVEGPLLLVNVGGTNASVVAFDKTTGKVVWKSGTDKAGYSSPVAMTVGTQRIVAMYSGTGLYGYDPADGKELWHAAWPMRDVYAADPVVLADKLFLPYPFLSGCILVKITDKSAEEVYHNTKSINAAAGFPGNANVVMIGDFLYGFAGPWEKPALICLDPATGGIKWKKDKIGGAFVAAGHKLLTQSVSGSLVLFEVSPAGYKELGSRPVLTGQCWTGPTLAQGCVYCRNTAGDVVCLDLSGQ